VPLWSARQGDRTDHVRIGRGVADDGAAVLAVDVDRDVAGQGDAVEPAVLVVVVGDGIVLGGPVVPDGQVAGLPTPANGVLQLGDPGLRQTERGC
jgi:hypothetical protein